jgi:hypothetical protein
LLGEFFRASKRGLSRARWSERLIAIVLIIAALSATVRINHESMGLLWLIGYGLPVLCLALVAWAAASRHLSDGPRRATMVATILFACGVWMGRGHYPPRVGAVGRRPPRIGYWSTQATSRRRSRLASDL